MDYRQELAAIRNGDRPKTTGKKVPEKVEKVSDKRKIEQQKYRKIVAEMMAESNECEIKEDGCQFFASGLHHMKKRSPVTFLDKNFLKRSCDNCNSWCELHPLEAIEKGHSVSKHKK
jgi:hypothetical protein